jgi:archaellum component FlaC
MNAKTLIIRELSRAPQEGPEDTLTFAPGVNVIVGPPNTGKTKWLRMLDYLLGDDGKPEDVFGDDLAAKYDSVKALIALAGEEIIIERRWKEQGSRTKAFVNGEALPIRDLWVYLMNRLEIPIVHYPQGNPYGSRAWPELSWRSLVRHLYRRQKFWTDLADWQPESEQHACLMQFLGSASHLFSEQYQSLVNNEKKITELQVAKDQFVSMLQEVSKEIIDEKELGVALTPQSIDTAIQRIQAEIDAVRIRREAAISELLDAAVKSQVETTPDVSRNAVEQLGEAQAQLNVEQEGVLSTLQKTETRLEEIQNYRNLIADEYSRMERAAQAGTVLADLKITHCPACDREVAGLDQESNCYLCLRPIDDENPIAASSIQRLDFELEHLKGELAETDQLIDRLEQDVQRLTTERASVAQRIVRVQQLLRPTRSAIAAILPPEILTTDVETGRLQERQQQLVRIKATLERREKLSDQINEIQQAVKGLEDEIREHNRQIDFERAGDLLSDGMNTYLNLIKSANHKSWTQEDVLFRLDDRKFSVKVGRSNWKTKLGGTLTLYFLIAYHYALMCLTLRPECNYPGLLLLDFPAELEDASSIADKENFVIEPFIHLLGQPGMETTQLIAAGSAFEDLEGANRIEFHKIWK